MPVRKYLSLEEARKKKLLERFVEEHPSEGNKEAIDSVLRKWPILRGSLDKGLEKV